VNAAMARPRAAHAETRSSRPLWVLLGANAVSLAGDRMAALAIPWFVLVTTGSAAKAGIVGFFTILPVVLAALFGGTIVDRLGARRTSVLADLLSGTTVAAIPALHAADLLSFPLLLLLVFAGALLDTPGGTARDALLPDLIERAGIRPERANGLYGAVNRSASLIGAPLAGVLIGVLGPTAVLWIDAATFAVSALAIGFAVPGRARHDGRVASDPAPATEGDLLTSFRAGLAFLWRDRLLRTLILTIAVTNLADAPLGLAMAVYVREMLGRPEALGLLFGAHGLTALAGALLFGSIGHRLPRRPVFAGAFLLVALPFAILATTPPLPLALLATLIMGVAAGPINPILMTVGQERVPPELRGRVFGAVRSVAWSAMPLGILAGGLLVEEVGAGAAFAVSGAIYGVAGVGLALNPILRQMERRRSAPSER
jgi:MFS family permease